MHVAVCIVAYRNPDDIAACLAALERQDHAEFEVVIVENGGAEAHARLAQGTRGAALSVRVRCLLAPGNVGFAGGVNRAMAAAPDADAWWVLNPDCEPAPGALRALVARLSSGDVDAVGGVLVNTDGTMQGVGGMWRAWAARSVSIGKGDDPACLPAQARVERRLDYLLGASMLVGRRFRDVAGPMREDYFLYAEEVEWCVRARARGLRLGVAPDARVLHRQGSTTGSNRALRDRPAMPIYLDERNRLNVVRDTTPALLPVAAIVMLGQAALRYGRRRAWAQWRAALAGWAAGLRDERGPGRFA